MWANTVRGLGCIIVLVALIAAPGTAPSAASPATNMSLALDWVIGGTHAGYFTALAKRHYRDLGLDVTIARGYGSGDTVKRVAAGAAIFGIADTGTFIAAVANENVPVRIVAMVYQKSTLGLIYLKQSGITKPKDLEGRTIARSAAGASVTLFPAFLAANGVDRQKIHEVVVDGATFLPLLLSRKVDAVERAARALPGARGQGGPDGDPHALCRLRVGHVGQCDHCLSTDPGVQA
jgi:NitT/TauT family transport system substrate-binding protein